MASVKVTTLTKHWPREKTVSRAKVLKASKEYVIGGYVANMEGFPVQEKLEKGTRLVLYISAKYRHALRLLNFKNACYISALSIETGVSDVESENGRKWAIILDGMARNLVFNAAVRQAFFEEIPNGLPKRKKVVVNLTQFRSITMDTWLLQEYLFRAHDPPSCRTLKRDRPYQGDPLCFGEFGLTGHNSLVFIT